MRINHNIAAMNTYRQLTGNTNATQKSLEKLSSGFRVNRAGDDAAGLAISEKMRGQIRGLNQASSNSQDTISLLQTAEGALGETHSILHRMRELAVQAANDTNVDQDRDEIQKEINQLTSEINRIGNTTEFNTKKLLNGGDGKISNIRYSVVKEGDLGADNAVGKVSALSTAAHSVKAGTVRVENFNEVTKSTKAATSGSIGSPLQELRASSTGGTGRLVGGEGAVVQAGAVTGAPAGFGAADVISIAANSASSAGHIEVDFAKSLGGRPAGASHRISLGTVNVDFTIGATAAASRDNFIIAFNALTTGKTNVAGAAAGTTDTSVRFNASPAGTAMSIGGANFATDQNAATISGAVQHTLGSVYTFELSTQFKAGDAIQIGSGPVFATFTAVAADASSVNTNEFKVGASIAETTENLLKALQMNSVTNAGYNFAAGSPHWSTDSRNSITVMTKAVGVDSNATYFEADLSVTAADPTRGAWKFEIASNYEAGQKISIKGIDFTARAAGSTPTTNSFVIGANIEATATSLLAAITASTLVTGGSFSAGILGNGTGWVGGVANLPTNVAGYQQTDLTTDLDTIVLVEGEADATAAANISGKTASELLGTVETKNVAEVKGKYSIDFADNFSRGDSVTIAGKSYTSGTAAEVEAGTAQFVVGTTIGESLDNLAAKVSLDNTFRAVKGDSAFVKENRLYLEEVVASGTKALSGTGVGATEIDATRTSAKKGEYSFKVDNNFAAGDRVVVDGRAFEAGKDFVVGATAKDSADLLSNALRADARISSKYSITTNEGTVTLKENVATGKDLSAPTVSQGSVAGSFKFTATALPKDSTVVIDGQKLIVKKGGTEAETAAELGKLIEGNQDLNEKYMVTVDGADVGLVQRAGFESKEGPQLRYETKAGTGFSAHGQIGANTGQSITLDVQDMRAKALGISAGEFSEHQVIEADGKQYAYSWTKLTSVSSGSDNNAVEFALDVTSHDKATAAVKVIDRAMAAVSAERSKLGAIQNRLEHTITNLGTTSENMTAAESRIRDVDMAKEMMEFTKNNILSQAAQAMLAQANQQPQGVLQLLR